MSCIGRRTDYDGWSDRSIEEDARLEVNSVVEVRLPPTASSGKRLQVNSNHSDVYEAAAWVRARVLRPAAATATVLVGADADSAALDQSTSADTTLHFGACEFELLYPDVVSFQTHSAASGHNAAETVVGGSSIAGLSADDEEVPPPRQLSFSEQRPASAQRPFTVTWHLSGPRRMLNSSSRNIRMAKTADPLDQAYIKDQAIEVFMTDDTRDAAQADKGVWCVGFVRENAAPESTSISVHIFGNLNDHPIRTSDGEEINGPNVFGYNIDIPRFPVRASSAASAAVAASATRMPIRAIRYIGVNGDGSVCRFGARQSAVAASVEEVVSESSTDALIPSKDSSSLAAAGDKRRSALEVGEPVALAPAPLWSQTISLILLLAMMCGIIIFMALQFSGMTQVYAEIYAVAVAACIILTIIALMLVAIGMEAANEAVSFIVSPNSTDARGIEPLCTPTKLVLLCPVILLAAAVAWAFVLSPLWLMSYLVEGLGGWPWWMSLVFDFFYLALAFFLLSLYNESVARKEVMKADEIGAHPLADFWAARHLEELRKMSTPVA